MILDIENILVSSDIITEQFCCDLDACKGICCVEGDAGAPVTLEEIGGIEDAPRSSSLSPAPSTPSARNASPMVPWHSTTTDGMCARTL